MAQAIQTDLGGGGFLNLNAMVIRLLLARGGKDGNVLLNFSSWGRESTILNRKKPYYFTVLECRSKTYFTFPAKAAGENETAYSVALQQLDDYVIIRKHNKPIPFPVHSWFYQPTM